jgi:hypothetical protein
MQKPFAIRRASLTSSKRSLDRRLRVCGKIRIVPGLDFTLEYFSEYYTKILRVLSSEPNIGPDAKYLPQQMCFRANKKGVSIFSKVKPRKIWLNLLKNLP